MNKIIIFVLISFLTTSCFANSDYFLIKKTNQVINFENIKNVDYFSKDFKVINYIELKNGEIYYGEELLEVSFTNFKKIKTQASGTSTTSG